MRMMSEVASEEEKRTRFQIIGKGGKPRFRGQLRISNNQEHRGENPTGG